MTHNPSGQTWANVCCSFGYASLVKRRAQGVLSVRMSYRPLCVVQYIQRKIVFPTHNASSSIKTANIRCASRKLSCKFLRQNEVYLFKLKILLELSSKVWNKYIMQTTPGDENETTTNSIKQQNNHISFTKLPYHYTKSSFNFFTYMDCIKVGLSTAKNCLWHSEQNSLS